MDDSERRITTETALVLLSKEQRRRILRRLAEAPDGTTLDRLGREMDEAAGADPAEEASLESRLVELHHVHLPLLRDANVIRYDPTRNSVDRGQHFQEVVSLLRAIDDHRDDASSAQS